MTVHPPLPAVLLSVPVVPVLRIEDPQLGVLAARALISGGLSVLEVTLRTRHALDVVRALRDALPEAVIAAGTILDPSHVRSAAEAGAQLLFSPGGSEALSMAAADHGCPLIPGVSTPSEVMAALGRGHRLLKFFPASANGGPPLLEAMRGPFPHARFCPTGGIRLASMGSYLALENVRCVGASWLVRDSDLGARDWAGIEAKAVQACEVAARAGWKACSDMSAW
jgi:2-dehydro-3-deoxyphosphogluconate aldolase/(4S)-4-hydroxy-2-oxoglutarate aldolase